LAYAQSSDDAPAAGRRVRSADALLPGRQHAAQLCLMRSREALDPAVETALLASERAGLRAVLSIRSVLLVALILFNLATQGIAQGAFGAAVTAGFLVIGLAYRWLVVRGRDRIWMRYAFVTLDCALLAVVAVTVPLSTHGEVPQIFVFRVFGVGIFFFILATSALSLSPRLVLWTGAASVISIWGAWGWIVSGMKRRVDWYDLEEERTAERYIEIALDPDMIGAPNRVVETLLLLACAAVTAVAVQRARRLLREQMAAERARGRVTEVFGRFVPAEVAERLGESGGTLPPAACEATVLFVDVEGFTRFAETAAPAHIVAVLDAFFDRVAAAVGSRSGVVISFVGDAAMASFNAPLDNPAHAASAIAAARDILVAAAEERFEGERLAIRIGMATGPVAAGTVGGRGRQAYTLYGDTVNLAQRLEALNKETGTRLLVAETTWRAAGAPEGFFEVQRAAVRGRAAAVGAYAPG
jgi:class 3 adenylate cyclase